MSRVGILTVILLVFAWAACSGASTVAPTSISTQRAPTSTAVSAVLESGAGADVIGISVSGDPGSYTFSVTVESPDTGCGQYADWWEVVSPEGRLIYRRVLLHSHVDEQPFTRSGGPVDVQPSETVIVQAHMNGADTGELGCAEALQAALTLLWVSQLIWRVKVRCLQTVPSSNISLPSMCDGRNSIAHHHQRCRCRVRLKPVSENERWPI